MPRQYKFRDQHDVISRHSADEIAHFEAAREKLRISNIPRIKRLLTNLDTAKKAENFLEYLVEFNIAHILHQKNVRFAYEPTGGDDFAWDDIMLSVKSIQPKQYELEEEAVLDRLEAQAIATGRPAEARIVIGTTERTFRVEPKLLSWERIEMGSAEPLLSDLKYGGPLMQYLAELEQKQHSGKKIAFFFSQSEAFEDCVIEDLASWYFRLPNSNPMFAGQYDAMFKTKNGKVARADSIDAIVFMIRPRSVLLWPSDSWSETHNDRKRVRIFSRDTNLESELLATLMP